MLGHYIPKQMDRSNQLSDYLLISISGVFLLGVLSASYFELVSPQLAAAIGSLGLVFATSLSLVTTRATLREQRRARKQQSKPVLRLTVKPTSLSGVAFFVENIGNGTARQPEVSIEAKPKDESSIETNPKISSKLPDIPSGELLPVSTGSFTIDNDSDQEFFSQGDNIDHDDFEIFSVIEMNGHCKDILGETHQVESSFNPKFLEKGFASHIGNDLSDGLRKIERELSDIERTLRRELNR